MTTFSEPEAMIRSKYAIQTPIFQDLDDAIDSRWDDPQAIFDMNMGLNSYPQQFSNSYSGFTGMNDLAPTMDPMDIEFQRFISVAT